MNLSEISKHLEAVRRGGHLEFDYGLVNRALGYLGGRVTEEEWREIALRYSELNKAYYNACNSIVRLAEDNRRLQAENDFMRRLVESRMKPEDI